MKRYWFIVVFLAAGVWAQIDTFQIREACNQGRRLTQEQVDYLLYDFWQVDSSKAAQWRRLPQKPILDEEGDTLPDCVWVEYEGPERLIKRTFQGAYRNGSIVKTAPNIVDTLYDMEKDR